MPFKNAYIYAIKLLTRQSYSEYKLRSKLLERNFQKEEVDSAIQQIKNRNFLQEESYTESRIKNFMFKGFSPELINYKLIEEKISVSDDLISRIFNENNVTVEDQIRQLASKKIKLNSTNQNTDKILRYLLSKGHEIYTCQKILKLMILP